MRVLLVDSNPSQSQEDPSLPFAGSRSHKVLDAWIKSMAVRHRILLANVSSKVTPKNRPLRVSEYELDALRDRWFLSSPDAVVALGKTAADALRRLNIDHFEMPHPSGRNRLLNDKLYVHSKLMECGAYLASKYKRRVCF